jgi:4,5-dihydroxyphthalate decarboxylase
MKSLAVTLATRDYDSVHPLALRDVVPDGIDLTLIRAFDALERIGSDPSIDGGEASFSQYLRRIAAGDRTLVGLPAFVMREFRHRCLFVRRGSGLTEITHLAGCRVGVDAWSATGNVWTRALFRERGVSLEQVQWMVAPVNPGEPPASADGLPRGVEVAPPGRALAELLAAGELDAIMCPWPPVGFDQPGSAIVRLYADYREAERDYYRRTRIFPAQHLVVLKRPVVERYPRIVPSLYAALKQARDLSEANHRVLHESSPWLLADLEEQTALMGADFEPYGYHENRDMVATFCAEQLAQGLIAAPLNPDALFSDFVALTGSRGSG